MKRTNWIREAVAVAAVTTPLVARAEGNEISASGWWSMLLVLGIVGALFAVHKKLT